MKNSGTKSPISFITALIAAASLWVPQSPGQPVSYMLPDIGAPGMSVYVEILGPHDAPGNFGADGLYPNNPGDPVRVMCLVPEDTAKITIGPVTVSWNGRMAAAQVFVHPGVTPNSTDWRMLDSRHIVPLVVSVNGNPSNSDLFYIVRPQPAIVGAGGGRFGEGSLGLRSRRGAMVVDSVILDNSVYGISTVDCDPGTPGNQGYLPFVLLSLGRVSGLPGTVINAGASGRHGGPGGGGGGGNFCDVTGSGSDGGGGFTGGGRGGRNGSGVPFATDEFRNPGESTGIVVNNTGAGLNGVPGGTTAAYEASGGGTGHPFGTSGIGCNDGANCNPPGGYGGGSGQRQTRGGGGGGYGTPGSAAASSNGGREHGNEQLTPLAGGSGGASGNPQGATICSGEGGGGGGAIRIYAPSISNITVNSHGGDGQDRFNGPGGSGSGGAVSVETKMSFNSGQLSVRGGTTGVTGGIGRVRIDGPRNTIVISQPGAGNFRGPSTDTSRYVPRAFLLTGTGNGEAVRIYLKSPGMPWTLHASVASYANNSWTQTITLPGADDIYFLSAVQEQPNPLVSDYAAQPSWVHSQASSNILLFKAYPRIAAAQELDMPAIACDFEARDTLFVRNDGDGALILRSAAFADGTRGLSLEQPPVFPLQIEPQDSALFVFRFAPSTIGPVSDVLVIESNDTAASRNPFRITVTALKDSVGLATVAPSMTFRRLLLCEGPYIDTIITVINTGSASLRVQPPVLSGAAFSLIDPPASAFPLSLGPSGSPLELRIRFTPDQAGVDAAGELRIQAEYDGCQREVSVQLAARADSAAASMDGMIDFRPLLCHGETADTVVTLRNEGTTAVSFEVPALTNPHFTILSPSFPLILQPGATQDVRIRFAPGQPGAESGLLRIAAEPCSISLRTDLTGRRDSAGIEAASLDFGLLPPSDLPAEQTVTVYNTGSIAVTLLAVAPTAGGPFSIVAGLPVVIQPGGSAALLVRFDDPGADGTYTAAFEALYTPACRPAYFTATASRGTASITLELDTLRASPGEYVDVPVYLRSSVNPRLFGASGVLVTLRHRADILTPANAPQGTVSGQDRIIQLSLPLLPDSRGILATLRFRATLGASESTPLLLEDAEGVGGAIEITTIPGFFELTGICREGGVRLFDGGARAELAQNHPNPFNPVTEIRYSLIEEGRVRLLVFDRLGRLVRLIFDGEQKPGEHSILFNADGLASGTYRYALLSGGIALSRTMTVMK